MKVYAPVNGLLKPIQKVKDDMFSQKMLGDGVAIIASDSNIVSPINGNVSSVFPTKHAIGITGDEGIEILLHIGIDTVELDGNGFTSFIKQGDRVKQGDKLVSVDFDFIGSKGYEKDVIIVVMNSNEFTSIDISDLFDVKTNDVIMNIK